MRIGLVTGEYPPMQGGVGDFTRELALALAALGHEPHVITNCEYYRLQITDCKSRDSNPIIHRVVKNWGWRCWAAIRAVAREVGLDVLNVQYQAAAYKMRPAINLLPAARRWLGLPPIVTTFHDLQAPYLFPKAGPLRKWVIQELARRSDGVIVTNHEDEQWISNFPDLPSSLSRDRREWEAGKFQTPALATSASAGASVSDLRRIPIGSNIAPVLPASYQRDKWRARWGTGPGDVLIAYFGFLHPLKGGQVLVRALAHLANAGRPVRVLFIGGKTGSSDASTNAAYATRVEALARELGVNERLIFTGYLTPPEVTAAFYASDVTALPYLEGASLRHGTLMAALAHGRAIVTTQSSVPSPELRDGENVLLTLPGDDVALANALARVIGQPALRAQLERGAAELGQQFTWDKIAAQTVGAYESHCRDAGV